MEQSHNELIIHRLSQCQISADYGTRSILIGFIQVVVSEYGLLVYNYINIRRIRRGSSYNKRIIIYVLNSKEKKPYLENLLQVKQAE